MVWMLRSSCALAVSALGLVAGCAAPGDDVGLSSHVSPTNQPPASVTSARRIGTPPVLPVSQLRPLREPRDLRVMSFNVRVAIFIDGPNYWDFRKRLLVETIRNFNPDLLGTQESVASQFDYLREQLPDYGFVGAGRSDGRRRGEMCGLFFRRSRFDRLDEGHFWLSETPNVPGSKSWGTANTRMVSWVKLRDRTDGNIFCCFNTHFDHRGKRARDESAKLLRQKINAIAGSLPVILTGDFNADENSQPYQTIITGTGRGDQNFVDTFRAANHSIDFSSDGTRHGFWGGEGGPRIDWILTSSSFQTLQAGIDHHSDGLRYPSDHFPVTAVLRPSAPLPVARVE